jgi:uncharacterized membrane protein
MHEPSSTPLPANGSLVRPPEGLGQRAADLVTRTLGSWRFILLQSTLLSIWVALNLTAWVRHWDPYPFILMNLVLSLQAAYAGPIIMMSQNRMAEHDRRVAHKDYRTDARAEREVRLIMDHLLRQDAMLNELLDRVGRTPAEAERTRGVDTAPGGGAAA